MPDFKPTICVDFDATIHFYRQGWQNGKIYDPHVPGFFRWLVQAVEHFEVVVYSSRSKTLEGIEAMQNAIGRWATEQDEVSIEIAEGAMVRLKFADQKPAAWLTIDDRCVQFRGDWSDVALSPGGIKAFRPWNAPVKEG